jgi:hypothetical protein
VTEPNPKPRKGSGQSQPAGQRPKGSGPSNPTGYRQSTSPTGTPRVGRRQTSRYRPAEPTLMQKLRTPVLALIVIAAIGLVAVFAVTSATQTAFACSTIDTVQAPVEGELGQVQPDMGNQHVAVGDKVTYPVCPPASGKHINNPPRGPIPPRFYGPDDSAVPNGWIHNLEHAGIVVLYSCDKGACDQGTLDQLKTIVTGLPNSPVCGTAPGIISPVVARFEQMPTKFAALVWGRVMYMDTLDIPSIFEFYTRYSERIQDGRFVAPPEPQCAVPSQSASPSASPAASPAASSEASPAASPSTEPSAVPDNSAAPSPAAS